MIAVALLLTYFLFQLFSIPILQDPTLEMKRGGAAGATIGVLLLILDILLPIPSSIVMVAHGALFGILVGSLLSIAGKIGCFSLGYFLGRKSLPFARNIIPQKEMDAAKIHLEKKGLVAIILTRPIPVLSETMAIVSGASALPFGKSLAAAILGSLPEAILFSISGTFVSNFNNTALIFLFILAIALIVHLSTRNRKR